MALGLIIFYHDRALHPPHVIQALVERAHREFLAASTPPPIAAAVAELEKQGREGSTEPPPPAYEAFLEGLSEDFPPLSKGVLEALEGMNAVIFGLAGDVMCFRLCCC